MAVHLALIAFEFDRIEDIYYNPELDHPFERHDPYPGEAIQPIIGEAVARIRRAMAGSISKMFNFGQVKITNMSNFLHLATMTFDAHIPKADFGHATTCIIACAKFYLLDPQISYKCTLDIEEMPNSSVQVDNQYAYDGGMTDKQIEKLVGLLNDEFNLFQNITYKPLIKRHQGIQDYSGIFQ